MSKLVELTQETIDRVFQEAREQETPNQGHYILALYRIVLGPDFLRATAVDGWPSCNKTTWKYIARKAMEFDQDYHPDCMAGGLWMNRGFTGANGLPDWTVDVAGCVLTLPQEEAAS